MEHGLFFNPEYKTSSSDKAFFKLAIDLGYKFVFVKEAPLYKIIPPDRWTIKYYIKRLIINGYNNYKIIRCSSSLTQVKTIFKSGVALFVYIIAIPFTLLLGKHWLVKMLSKIAYHSNRLSATFEKDRRY